MANEQLTSYIQKELKKGVSEEQIRQALTKANWATADVNEAFKSIKPIVKEVKKVVPEEVKPKKLEPEQILKGIIGEEAIKEEKVIEEPVKTEESWFNRKKRLILIAIGIFILIMIYYIYEFIKS